MKLFVTVKAGAKTDRVERIDETHFRVSVKARAKQGEANEAVVRVLAEYFKVPRMRLAILRGQSSKTKILQIA